MIMKVRDPSPWSLFLFPLTCVILGGLSGYMAGSGPDAWYTGLAKSPLNPPGWTFGVVWPILYLVMGLAAALVYRRRFSARVSGALTLFMAQLVVNLAWSWVFFSLHLTLAAFFHIVILWILVLMTVIGFYRVSRPAAWLMVPYLAWITFAGYLAYMIWRLNG